MKWHRYKTSLEMHFRMLMRRRIVLLLLTVIPCLFIFLVHVTASTRHISFQVAASSIKTMAVALEVNVALIFVTMATIGFLAAFLSLNLVQQYNDVNRRLVICGYRPAELILSGLSVMIFMVLILVLCIGTSIHFFFEPKHSMNLLLGMFLSGITYGSYGMMVGGLVKGELEGTLMVVLLANIDAGWLQNPIFFSEARNKLIIQLLPAYNPSQVSIASAFTDIPVTKPLLMSIIYTVAFLTAALCIAYYNMRIKKHVRYS